MLAHGAAAAFVAGLALPAGGRPRPKLVWQTTSALSSSSFGRVQRTCWQVALPHVDGAVALTAEIGRELRDFGYRGPMWTIPNARRIDRFVDLDRDREARALRTEIGVGPEVPVIGLVGYLVREKQPALAVEVLAGGPRRRASPPTWWWPGPGRSSRRSSTPWRAPASAST